MNAEKASELPGIAECLNAWDRWLLAVSIPHGAALGVYIGRYEIRPALLNDAQLFFELVPVLILPVLGSACLYFVYGNLRSLLLVDAYYDRWISGRHILMIFIPSFFPLAIIWYGRLLDSSVHREVLALIGYVFSSWLLCATGGSFVFYRRIKRILRSA